MYQPDERVMCKPPVDWEGMPDEMVTVLEDYGNGICRVKFRGRGDYQGRQRDYVRHVGTCLLYRPDDGPNPE